MKFITKLGTWNVSHGTSRNFEKHYGTGKYNCISRPFEEPPLKEKNILREKNSDPENVSLNLHTSLLVNLVNQKTTIGTQLNYGIKAQSIEELLALRYVA